MINSVSAYLKAVFNLKQEANSFSDLALFAFKYQYIHCKIYKDYCNGLMRNPQNVKKINEIPFLPISFFKTHTVLSAKNYNSVFHSSGTTSANTSKHYITDIDVYKNSFRTTFKTFFGNPKNYVILALLPNYLEQQNSSLIFMVNDLIAQADEASGFYLNKLSELSETIATLDKTKKVLLFGVTYALLDLIEHQKFNLKNTIILETGGMKGRRKEITRPELHEQLQQGFGVSEIYSEYGMTELLSQGYSKGSEFKAPPYLKVLMREVNDPFTYAAFDKTGGINVIDLANIHSCCFIETQDLGKQKPNGNFEVLGRFDNSEVRGCNLLV